MSSKFFRQIKQDLICYGGLTFKTKIYIFLFSNNFRLLLSYRIRRRLKLTKLRYFNIYLKYKQNIKYGSDISDSATLGENIQFPHAFGIIIGAAIIENNVKIFQQVTIGSHGVKGAKLAWPIIKEGTVIYSGAKILGGIVIGKNCTIGANTVVNRDLPDNAIVVSPSSKIVGYNSN